MFETRCTGVRNDKNKENRVFVMNSRQNFLQTNVISEHPVTCPEFGMVWCELFLFPYCLRTRFFFKNNKVFLKTLKVHILTRKNAFCYRFCLPRILLIISKSKIKSRVTITIDRIAFFIYMLIDYYLFYHVLMVTVFKHLQNRKKYF